MELALDKAEHQAGLPNGWLPQQHQFKLTDLIPCIGSIGSRSASPVGHDLLRSPGDLCAKPHYQDFCCKKQNNKKITDEVGEKKNVVTIIVLSEHFVIGFKKRGIFKDPKKLREYTCKIFLLDFLKKLILGEKYKNNQSLSMSKFSISHHVSIRSHQKTAVV